MSSTERDPHPTITVTYSSTPIKLRGLFLSVVSHDEWSTYTFITDNISGTFSLHQWFVGKKTDESIKSIDIECKSFLYEVPISEDTSICQVDISDIDMRSDRCKVSITLQMSMLHNRHLVMTR